MPQDRPSAYQALVDRRRAHRFPAGLLNPSEIEGGRFDSDALGPWSRWQGSLDAEVLVIGQDWGDLAYFLRNRGQDDPDEPTCRNLRHLALLAGWDLGTPLAPIKQRLFFTNAVMGIRSLKGKSGAVSGAWIRDSLPFLTGILDLLQPRAVITLGTIAAKACRLALDGTGRTTSVPAPLSMATLHGMGPIRIPGKPLWFPFYHCSPLGLVNRSLSRQGEDWKTMAMLQQSPMH